MNGSAFGRGFGILGVLEVKIEEIYYFEIEFFVKIFKAKHF